MAVELVKREVEVPKELDEVRQFLVALVDDIRAKKDVSLIVGENLTGLMSAIQGFDKLSEEVKTKEVYAVVALLVTDLIAAFTKK